MWKKLVVSALLIPVIFGLVETGVVCFYPDVLSMDIQSFMPVRGKQFSVVGTVELQRNSTTWTAGPDGFYWFNVWWQGEEEWALGPEDFSEATCGVLKLVSIEWEIVESKPDSDVLQFNAVVEVLPGAWQSPPWARANWKTWF